MSENRVPGELELQVSSTDKPEQADEFILTPSQEESEVESAELTLEAEGVVKVSEITFDGEAEFEARIEEAMKEYDAAMNKAAGIG